MTAGKLSRHNAGAPSIRTEFQRNHAGIETQIVTIPQGARGNRIPIVELQMSTNLFGGYMHFERTWTVNDSEGPDLVNRAVNIQAAIRKHWQSAAEEVLDVEVPQ